MKLNVEIKNAYCKLAKLSLTSEKVVIIHMKRETPSKSNLEELKRCIAEVMEPYRRLPFVIDTTDALPMLREDRLVTDNCLNLLATRVAYCYTTELGKMIARLNVRLSQNNIEQQNFDQWESALDWALNEQVRVEVKW